MPRCLLDILPVELFHALFSYFLAHEILFTFTNVTPYIDAILVSYTDYRVDFKSILKIHFDLVCRTISPNQIISLTLSGLDDTPKQCQIFFTHFRIEQFSKIRLLRLININRGLMEEIVNSIDQLNPHCRLAIDDCDIRTLISSPLIYQLIQLKTTDNNQFDSYRWSDFIPYRMNSSSITPLQCICQMAPKLQSLDICWKNDISNIVSSFQIPQLNSLVLKIEGKYIGSETSPSLY